MGSFMSLEKVQTTSKPSMLKMITEMKDRLSMSKLGRKVETMVPFMCGNLSCKDRQRVVLADDGTVRSSRRKNEDKKEE